MLAYNNGRDFFGNDRVLSQSFPQNIPRCPRPNQYADLLEINKYFYGYLLQSIGASSDYYYCCDHNMVYTQLIK